MLTCHQTFQIKETATRLCEVLNTKVFKYYFLKFDILLLYQNQMMISVDKSDLTNVIYR